MLPEMQTRVGGCSKGRSEISTVKTERSELSNLSHVCDLLCENPAYVIFL